MRISYLDQGAGRTGTLLPQALREIDHAAARIAVLDGNGRSVATLRL
jgi:hypothetical protein